jgi:hypothetical protein
MEPLTCVQLFLIGVLQIMCLLFLAGLVYDLYISRGLLCLQYTRLAIWVLALGDAITLMVFTANGAEHG